MDNEIGQHLSKKRNQSPRALMSAFLAVLEKDQRRLLRLCTALETIADGLPASARHRRAAKTLPLLSSAFDKHIFLHEKCLFPLIRSLAHTDAPVEAILLQLEFEHASDQGLIVEMSSAFAVEPGDNTLGYLFRAFFDNYRRHSAWERNSLYSVVRTQLGDEGALKQHQGLLRLSLGFRR